MTIAGRMSPMDNRTRRMTYEWYDKGVSMSPRGRKQSAMQCAREFQRQKVLTKAAGNWSKEFLRTSDVGLAQVRQPACTGVKCDLMDNKRRGWECMLQL
jgi:hypothetical protein